MKKDAIPPAGGPKIERLGVVKPVRSLATVGMKEAMVGCQIPFQPAETWHLSRLLTLIRVCQIQQDPKPPYSVLRQQHIL